MKAMKTTIIKGWDKINITRAILFEFQLVVMETNIITPFSKETIVAKEIMEVNVNINSAFPIWRIAFNLQLHCHL
jgi:hypothetical protein